MTRLAVLGFLFVATFLEAGGDAVVRIGLNQSAPGLRALLFSAAAALLFGYGLMLNLAPIPFDRVIGIYVAVLFVVWQIVSFVAFRSLPSFPVLIGGGLIVAGGAVVAFWQSS